MPWHQNTSPSGQHHQPTRTVTKQHEFNQRSVSLCTRGQGGHARLVLCEPGSEAVLAAAEKRVPAPESHRRRRPAYDALALHCAPLPGEAPFGSASGHPSPRASARPDQHRPPSASIPCPTTRQVITLTPKSTCCREQRRIGVSPLHAERCGPHLEDESIDADRM